MSLPETGPVSVLGGNDSLPKAFLSKLPPFFWKQFGDSAQSKENFKISLDNGQFKIISPSGDEIVMTAHTTGVPTEIHAVDASGAGLQPIALATARLTAPIAGPATKPSLPTKAMPVKPMAALLAKSSAATSMSRTQSSPAGTGVSTTPTVTPGVSPKIPLKTRVIQLLAFINSTEAQIAAKLESPAADVMRVVNVLGRPVGSAHTPVYELQPAQYSKVKINDWTYTGMEKKIVIKRARKAFDELDLPPGADERVALDKKEKEAMTIRPKASQSPPDTPAAPPAAKISPYSQPKILPNGMKLSDMPPIKKIKKPEVEAETKETKVAPKSTKPASGSTSADTKPSETIGRAIKKVKPAPKTTFGKELEKHRAGKRGTSMPSGKAESGVASPRPAAKSTLSKSTKAKDTPKLSFDERMKRSAQYSDTDSDSDSGSEDDKPTPPRKVIKVVRPNPRAISAKAPASAPAPAPAQPQKLSPGMIELALSFSPEAEAKEAAEAAAQAKAEAEAAAEAATKAKAKAELAAANAAHMAAALRKRPAEDYPPNPKPTFAKKARVSPVFAHLGLPARPLEDCQIIDTNPLKAEPIARPRTGSQPSTHSSGSPYTNGYAMAMDRSHSSNGSNRHMRQESQPLNQSQNSTQSPFENRASIGGSPRPAQMAPPPELSQDEHLREKWASIYPAYKALLGQLRTMAHVSLNVSEGTPDITPDSVEFQRLMHRYQRWHEDLGRIRVHFGGRSPNPC